MKRLQFNIEIDAPREKVWEVLWGENTYPQWTKPFDSNSRAESDWQEGSKVLFLAEGGHGMYSTIEKKIENEYMSFRHIGEIADGKELPVDEETNKWSGSMENYTLEDAGGKTRLSVEVDTEDAHIDMFNKIFPESMEIIKSLSEKG